MFARTAAAALLGGVGVLVVACNLVLGLKDGVLPTPTDAASEVATPGDERPLVLPDASTAVCTADGGGARQVVDDSDAVFVLPGGSTIVSSCGTKVDPCGTIAVGITVANANRAKALYLGPGTYDETITMQSGLSIEGGFMVQGSTWTALCDNLMTTIAPSTANVVQASGILNAALGFLTVETKGHGAPGEAERFRLARQVRAVRRTTNHPEAKDCAGPEAIPASRRPLPHGALSVVRATRPDASA